MKLIHSNKNTIEAENLRGKFERDTQPKFFDASDLIR
jgi:hypothetical protein